MTVLESIYVGLFGMAVVFIVLVGLSLIVRLQTALVTSLSKPKRGSQAAQSDAPVVMETPKAAAVADEPLKLINVDEKTAAIIMAIVSDNLQAQPNELYFKSIKALPENTEE
jgi:sodium pump decarboxylase gamma subunit